MPTAPTAKAEAFFRSASPTGMRQLISLENCWITELKSCHIVPVLEAMPRAFYASVTHQRFLRSAMRHRNLSICHVTLKLLCDALAVQPEFMRTHVLSTMLHLGQESSGATSPRMAALFVELKLFMTPYWRQPLPLRYLCVNRIRGALGPKNISSGALQLELPSTLLKHIHLH